MSTTNEIRPGRKVDLDSEVIGFDQSDRRARVVEQVSGRPPRRIDGFSVSAPLLTGDAPHDGEMHPDGDELLYLLSGAVTVRLELTDGHEVVEMAAGDALVVPQGTWHKVTLREPGRLLHITPGPRGEHRPLGSAAR